MVMTVKLFKNAKVDGVTRLGNWTSLSSQKSYFDSLTARTFSNVPTVRIGQPLKINSSFNDLLQYGYGYIDYGDGFRYYFVVANLNMVTETLTEIDYTIDVWETAKCQTNMSLKRAAISRYPSQIGKTVNPYAYDKTIRTKISSYKQWNVVALWRDSTTNTTKTLVNNNPELTSVSDGSWLPSSYSATDVISAGIVADSWSSAELVAMGFTLNDGIYEKEGIPLINTHKLVSSGTIGNDGTTWYEITDLRGNTVFTVPYGTNLTVGTGVVDISASSIQLRYVAIDSETSTKYNITIPSEVPTVIADSWSEYYLRQRSIDTETRNLQMNQQLMSSLANSASGSVSGAVGGAMAGVGAGVGAVAGVATGVISALGNYAISAYYSPKQQALIDKSYQNANDTIMMVGGASSYLYVIDSVVGVVKVQWDDTVRGAYVADVTNNGYYVNYSTNDMDSMLVTGPIQATVEVFGDIPVAWKEQITNRFANGVYLV